MHQLKSLFLAAPDAAAYMRGSFQLIGRMLASLDEATVANLATLVEQTGAAGRTIYTLGNGGSAVVASHFVNDMGVNSWVEARPGFRVISLADSAASITAVANDVGLEEIFSRQLECGLVAGDLVIALSVSGNSPNVLRAVEFANGAGGVTVGLSGFDGGRLAKLARHAIVIPSSSDEYGPVEDAFSVIFHAVSSYLTMRRGRFLHH
jgi:D-sedoheptulose 7-phosphate isomerase